MDNPIILKKTITAMCCGAAMFIAGALLSSAGWITAALMSGGIALMGIGGSYYIRITWMKLDNLRKKNQWREFDFGQVR